MTTKIIRTPKEWTEPCRQCAGTGTVHKRESFALWTPDEHEAYGPVSPLDAKHDVPADAYVCVAHGGATISEACKEGVGLARMVGRPVVFEFNGAVAICRQDSDPAQVTNAWWRKAYGETYGHSRDTQRKDGRDG